jgi:hypothetical protein
MAIIQDPDLLNQNTEVIYNTTAKTVQLAVAGNLSTDGVTMQALYSFTKEEWKTDATLIKYPFPFIAITPEQFEFVNGWTYANTTTINLIRNAGFAVKNTNGTSAEEYAGVITLGSIGSTDQVYFTQAVGGASSNIVLTGPVNQAIKVYGDATHGNFNYRSYLKLFVREQAKIYANADLPGIGVSTMTYQAYRFPLANQSDLKVTHSDVVADAYGVSVTYYASPQSRTIGGTSYQFSVIVNGGSRVAEEIYEAVQSLLRKATDIDQGAGTVTGKTATSLLTFVGDTLVTSTGVYIDNFQATDINRIEFYDNTGTKRVFPFVASGTISFNSNLVSDGNAIYKMYYTTNFGTASATLVLNSSDVAIQGNISASSVSFDYDYDGDTNGGGAGIDKNVTVVAIGLGTAQYVAAEGTITRSNRNAISLVSTLERNYRNP